MNIVKGKYPQQFKPQTPSEEPKWHIVKGKYPQQFKPQTPSEEPKWRYDWLRENDHIPLKRKLPRRRQRTTPTLKKREGFAHDNLEGETKFKGTDNFGNPVKRTENLRRENEMKLKTVTGQLHTLKNVTGQKENSEIADVITKEITEQDVVKVSSEICKREQLHFGRSRRTWRENKKEYITKETTKKRLQEDKTWIRISVVRSFFDSSRQNLLGTGLTFSDSEISRLQAELFNNRGVHLRTDALTLCSMLLLDSLPQSKCIFVTFKSLQSNENMLLHALHEGHWEWLIVSCDSAVKQSDISDTCLDISRYTETLPSNKHIIILTQPSVKQKENFLPVEHKFSFEHLSKKSQEMVLDKKIDFQGCEVTMRSVLQRQGNVQHVLGPELVTDLATEGTPVNIGGKLHVNTGTYVPRFLKRNIYLRLEVLRNSASYPDIFAVSGIDEKDLVERVPSDEVVVKFHLDKHSSDGTWTGSYNKFKASRFVILSGKHLRLCFSKLCERHSGKTLHWLKFKNKNLLWKKSCGDVNNLLDYIIPEETCADKQLVSEYMMYGSCEVDATSIWDLGERTVLVVAEPGMGKSSTTTQVARHTKERDPTSWVVRINWNEHTGKLQEIDAATFNFDSLVEFLCSAAFSDSKYKNTNRNLLKEALKDSGNVTVLMDGFDAISPQYADKAAVILSELMNTKVRKVWVTSRPAQTERLEKELGVPAFTLKKHTYESQE